MRPPSSESTILKRDNGEGCRVFEGCVFTENSNLSQYIFDISNQQPTSMVLFDKQESEEMSQRLFVKMDLDRNNFITITDLRTCYQSLGLYPTNTELKRILKEACGDSPRKDRLGFSQFRHLRQSFSNCELNLLVEFKKYDVDDLHRGFITPYSIQLVLKQDNWPEEEILRAISFALTLDSNNDQKISFQDFSDYVHQIIPDAWLSWIHENVIRDIPCEDILSVLLENGFNATIATNLIEKTRQEGRLVSKQTFADRCGNYVHVIKE
ncbi:hypothetical protein P9112_004705 [Eukaryota sp. TZLM1-RC]